MPTVLIQNIRFRCVSCRAYIRDERVKKTHAETFRGHVVVPFMQEHSE